MWFIKFNIKSIANNDFLVSCDQMIDSVNSKTKSLKSVIQSWFVNQVNNNIVKKSTTFLTCWYTFLLKGEIFMLWLIANDFITVYGTITIFQFIFKKKCCQSIIIFFSYNNNDWKCKYNKAIHTQHLFFLHFAQIKVQKNNRQIRNTLQ